jgi:glycyl-tRNA synthetase
LRVREFTLAEIEHFVDPEDKSHPKFGDVSDLEFWMFPREDQMAGRSATRLKLGNSISEVLSPDISLLYIFDNMISELFFCYY